MIGEHKICICSIIRMGILVSITNSLVTHSTVVRALDVVVLKFYESLEAVLVKLSGCFSVTSSSSTTLRQVQLAVDKIS